jgi:hypothetical protein
MCSCKLEQDVSTKEQKSFTKTQISEISTVYQYITQRELDSSFTRVAAAQKVLDKGCLAC